MTKIAIARPLCHVILTLAFFVAAISSSAFAQYPVFQNTGNPSMDSANFQAALQNYDAQKAALLSSSSRIDKPVFKKERKQDITAQNPMVFSTASSRTAAQSCIIPTDATWSVLPGNDDGSTGVINLGFTFNLYGTNYNQVFINNNGNLTFGSSYFEYNPAGFPLASRPMVSAFWDDIDTRTCGAVRYKLFGTRLVVSYEVVGQYNQNCGLRNTFQIVIGTLNDPLIGNGQNVKFFYGDMQWSKGASTVGINSGSNSDYVQVGRFGVQGSTAYDGGGGSNDGVDYLDYQCFSFNVSNVGNQPPSMSGFPTGNTVSLGCGETANYIIQSLPPEVNQTVTTTVNTNGMCGVTTSITNGAVSTVNISVTGNACNAGTNVITFTSTDNGTPALTTTSTLTVIVGFATPTISAGGPTSFCAGGSVSLTSSTGSSYQWKLNGSDIPGANGQTYLASATGNYSVAVTNGTCTVSSGSTNVTAYDNPVPVISASGPTTFCPGGSVTLSTANAGSSYLWSTGATTQSINATEAGSYTVTVTQASGCSATSLPTVVAHTTGPDYDGDGMLDPCDADDDNDGITDFIECNSSNFYWSNSPTESGNTATGTINGINYIYTSSQTVLTSPSVFSHSTFPSSYNIPNIKCIRNIFTTSNTLTFSTPIENPVLVFASIGNGGVAVPIEFTVPIDILWSTNVVQNSSTKLTGTEGYAIVRLNGIFSSISFNYLATENYVNFLFGADFQSCGDTDGDSIPDYLDADSDGDGCSDAIEGDQNPDASLITNGRLTGGIDANGVPLAVNGGQGLGTSKTSNINCHCQPGIDKTAPVPNVASLPTITAECGATISAPKATDICAGEVIGVTTDPTAYNTQGTFIITWKYTDGVGNQSTQTQTVLIDDVTPPVISCPFNITVNNTPGQCGAVVNYNAPSATDNCGSGVLPTSLAGHTYMGTFGGHTYFLSNAATVPETAHANAIAAGGHLVTISSEAENAFISAMNPGFIWIGYTDRASEGTWKWVTSEPVTFTKWNAGEPNNFQGNEDWAVINWGPNGTWNDWFYTSTARYVIEFEGGNIPTTRTGGLGSGSFFPVGTTTETWKAVDAGGNEVSCTFTVTVIDNQAPVPDVANLPVATGECSVTVTPPTATDNCGGSIIGTTNNPTVYNNQGTYTIVWTYNDGNGNVSTQNQTVVVDDVTAPVISCPSPITVNNDAGKCGAFVNVPAPVISDNCNVVCNTEGLDEYSVGPVTGKSPQWTLWPGGTSALVTNERFLSAPNSLKVTGHPNGGPVDQVFKLGNQTSGNWILSFKMFIPTGNTGYYNLQHTESLNNWAHQVKFNSNGTGVLDATGPNVNFSYPQGQWFEVKQLINQGTDQTSLYINGVLIKTWQFSALANVGGNINQLGAFNFYPITNSSFMGAAETNLNALPLAYIDDITLCGDATQMGTYISRRYSKVYPVGTTPAEIIISDLGGNSVTCSATTVTVVDAEKPTISAPAAVSVNADNGSCAATGVALGTPVTADNCGVASVMNDAPASYPVGSTTVTWTVTDIHGNVSSATQTVTVTDDQDPVLTCTSDKFYCYTGNQYATGTLSATDNCGIASITYEVTGATSRSGSGNDASGTFNVGTSTITWIVTDVNGNTTRCSSTVTINPPISVSIPNASAYTNGVQPNTVYVGYGPAQSLTYTAQPTGGTAPYTYSWSTGATSQSITVSPTSVGVHGYTVTITDAKGCTATFTKLVTVVDVRCGNKMDKVLVCHKTGSASNPWVQICIAPAAVSTHLGNGSYLGACITPQTVTQTTPLPVGQIKPQVVVAYPNPNLGKFALELKDFASGKVQVQILDMLGRTVEQRQVTVTNPIELVSFDLDKPAGGVYQARVTSQGGVSTVQVIIAR